MREQSHSANTENIVNHDVDKVDKLQQEFNELKQILYTHVLQNSANNKNVEKYNSVISENLTTTTGVQNKKGTKQITSAKSAEKNWLKNRLRHKGEKHEKFIIFSNQQLSDSLLALFLKGSNLSRQR